MKTRIPPWLAAAAAAAVMVAAQAAAPESPVSVSFVEPERFADLGDRVIDEPRNLKTIEAWFKTEGDRYLTAGQSLRIEITDVDLAGHMKPGRLLNDLRVVSGQADWPTIQLRYVLESGGQTLRSGEERLSDLNYLGYAGRLQPGDPLRYEKKMIDDWFKARFGADGVAAR
jgi:Protein of unknown function (DUF3016)